MNKEFYETTITSAYGSPEVAKVCLKCTRPEPNCGNGCIEYQKAVNAVTNKLKGQAGGRKANRQTVYGVEFSFPQLAVGVGFTAGAVRARFAKYGGDAEMLVRSFDIFTAADLTATLQGGYENVRVDPDQDGTTKGA